MNIPAAIEQALTVVIRKFAKLGEGVQVRPWQVLALDDTVGAAGLREYPLVDVRAAPPSVDENQHTSRCVLTVIVATKDGDDPQHAIISAMYDAVQSTLDRLFSQFLQNDEAGDVYAAFLAALTELLSDVGYEFTFEGFTFGDGLSPRNDNGANMIGTTLIVHYGRSDF